MSGQPNKQVCRDELVVYLSFSPHNIYMFMLKVSKTVLLLAALTFTIWAKTTGCQTKKTKTREAL